MNEKNSIADFKRNLTSLLNNDVTLINHTLASNSSARDHVFLKIKSQLRDIFNQDLLTNHLQPEINRAMKEVLKKYDVKRETDRDTLLGLAIVIDSLDKGVFSGDKRIKNIISSGFKEKKQALLSYLAMNANVKSNDVVTPLVTEIIRQRTFLNMKPKRPLPPLPGEKKTPPPKPLPRLDLAAQKRISAAQNAYLENKSDPMSALAVLKIKPTDNVAEKLKELGKKARISDPKNTEHHKNLALLAKNLDPINVIIKVIHDANDKHAVKTFHVGDKLTSLNWARQQLMVRMNDSNIARIIEDDPSQKKVVNKIKQLMKLIEQSEAKKDSVSKSINKGSIKGLLRQLESSEDTLRSIFSTDLTAKNAPDSKATMKKN